jgi:hypothetical protein
MELESVIMQALENAKKWSLSEQLEVFQHVVNVLTQLKFIKQYSIDTLEGEVIPDEMDNYFKKLDELTTLANKKINFFLAPLVFLQLSDSIENSTKYLKNVSKRKRRKKSRIIKKFEEELKNDEKFKKQMKKLEKIIQEDIK